MKTVLNTNNYDQKSQPMFLGETMGIQRFDQIKYDVFYKNYHKQQEFMWRPNEINLTADRAQYRELDEIERFIFDENLKFQTMGDSLLSRTLDCLKSYVSLTELEASLSVHSMMEVVHSESYTWVLDNVHPDRKGFFDNILNTPEIVERANVIKKDFDSLLSVGCDNSDPREEIFRTVLSLQIAEGVFFYNSFACSFWFGSRGKMRGNADIIKLIARDENCHLANTMNIMKFWRDNPEENFQDVFAKNEDLIYETYKMAAEKEKEWARHLFHKGSLMGMNEEILCNYTEWLVNLRLANMGFKKIFDQKENPLKGWINEYMDSSKTASMPQETEITSYCKGAYNSDLDDIGSIFDD